jgi:hypothetical protein
LTVRYGKLKRQEKFMRKLIAGSAMAAMLACSTLAQAAPVAMADVRGESSISDSEAAGGATLWLGILGLVVLGLIVWQISDESEANLPVSA